MHKPWTQSRPFALTWKYNVGFKFEFELWIPSLLMHFSGWRIAWGGRCIKINIYDTFPSARWYLPAGASNRRSKFLLLTRIQPGNTSTQLQYSSGFSFLIIPHPYSSFFHLILILYSLYHSPSFLILLYSYPPPLFYGVQSNVHVEYNCSETITVIALDSG